MTHMDKERQPGNTVHRKQNINNNGKKEKENEYLEKDED